jgi:ankyrin repeat protein
MGGRRDKLQQGRFEVIRNIPAAIAQSRGGSAKRRNAWLSAMAGALALFVGAVPAHAQGTTDYKFLNAVRDKDGNTVTQLLNEPGADLVNARESVSGDGALHIVAQRRDITWVRFLLAKGARPNMRNGAGDTPLIIAARLGWAEGVEALVAAGADVEVTDRAGETPLITATHAGDVMLMRALLQAGADPDRTDNSGRSARDYAQLAGGNLTGEIRRNEKPRAKSSKETYGPSF